MSATWVRLMVRLTLNSAYCAPLTGCMFCCFFWVFCGCWWESDAGTCKRLCVVWEKGGGGGDKGLWVGRIAANRKHTNSNNSSLFNVKQTSPWDLRLWAHFVHTLIYKIAFLRVSSIMYDFQVRHSWSFKWEGNRRRKYRGRKERMWGHLAYQQVSSVTDPFTGTWPKWGKDRQLRATPDNSVQTEAALPGTCSSSDRGSRLPLHPVQNVYKLTISFASEWVC
jgi:hypothetical protein